MYKNMTFELLLNRMLDNVPNEVDKREGSVIYDALAPAALELASFYAALGDVIDETFADSAGHEMLVRRAAERGISPYPATFAVVRGEFNTAVPLGTRFSLDGNELRYKVTERISGNVYKLICENIGSVGNRSVGNLLPVDYIEGLTLASVTELLIPGEDDETTEHLRKRYFDNLESQSYGGNISDYKRIVLAVPGVGGVKVIPVWDGGGTVKLIIQDYQWGVPSGTLVSEVKNIIDPERNSGLGFGLAPIGHSVTVEAVGGVVIGVSAEFTMVPGWQFDDIKSDLEGIFDGYLSEVAAEWAQSDAVIIRASQLESRFLEQSGVLDIENLSLNSENDGGLVVSAGRNITLSPHCIPLRGEIITDDN